MAARFRDGDCHRLSRSRIRKGTRERLKNTPTLSALSDVHNAKPSRRTPKDGTPPDPGSPSRSRGGGGTLVCGQALSTKVAGGMETSSCRPSARNGGRENRSRGTRSPRGRSAAPANPFPYALALDPGRRGDERSTHALAPSTWRLFPRRSPLPRVPSPPCTSREYVDPSANSYLSQPFSPAAHGGWVARIPRPARRPGANMKPPYLPCIADTKPPGPPSGPSPTPRGTLVPCFS